MYIDIHNYICMYAREVYVKPECCFYLSALMDLLIFFLGTYAFIETSAPQKPGDTAWLVSEMFPASLQRCIQFWYHMAGADIGTLNVYMRGQNNTMYRIWTLSGEQGRQGSSNVWMSGQAPLQSTVDYQVVLRIKNVLRTRLQFLRYLCRGRP